MRNNKAELYAAYQQQQQVIKESCEQMKVLFGVCGVLLVFNILW